MDLGGSSWGLGWFQQVKGLKAHEKAKRLEYGTAGEHLTSMEEVLGSNPTLQR